MRKIIATAFVSLDGVMQGPGGPQEDTSGGFDLGGWTTNYRSEKSGAAVWRWWVPWPSHTTCCWAAKPMTTLPLLAQRSCRQSHWACVHKSQQICADGRFSQT